MSDKMQSRIIDYIRDVKGPKGKRSINHLSEHFKNYDRNLFNDAINELIEKKLLIHVNTAGMVGPESNFIIGLGNYHKDWLIYNPYPKI